MRLSTRARTAGAAIALVVTASGCGSKPTETAGRGATRTVDLMMTDNAFQPGQMQVMKGETVTMRFRNNGSLNHEAILGNDAAQMRHHAEMTAATAPMDHGRHAGQTSESSPDAITVEPGKTGEITHTFTESGTVFIGCHEPGHWEAGMKATVAVT
jgi:uncharacterized cupredoxin-like copper-binding protein